MTLEILICTYNHGIKNIADNISAPINGVYYLISWQQTGSTEYTLPPELIRDDIKIYVIHSSGLSINRNNSLKHATADICLISDDDVKFNTSSFDKIINLYEENSGIDLATFKFSSKNGNKKYPEKTFNWNNPPEGFNVTSIEISFKRGSVQNRLKFNELMGIGAPLAGAGEENLFLYEALHSGLNCIYYPINIGTHNDISTGQRCGGDNKIIFARGILNRVMYPNSYIKKDLILAWATMRCHGNNFFKTLITLFKATKYAEENGFIKSCK